MAVCDDEPDGHQASFPDNGNRISSSVPRGDVMRDNLLQSFSNLFPNDFKPMPRS
jgi:hypothetical protein